MVVEPRRRSLVIMGRTSVVRVLVYDCCEHFVLVGGLCERFPRSPRIEFNEKYAPTAEVLRVVCSTW